jgi:hypothetical protein
MPDVQNRMIAFLFLLIVAVPLLLSAKFILEENLIQQEVEEKMSTAVLQSINIAKADIVWVRNGKEILVGDKYFDVRHFEMNGEMVTLSGYFDSEETELVSAFKKYTDDNNRDNPLSKSAFNFLFPAVYNSFTQIFYGSNWHSISNNYYSFSEMLPAAPSLSFILPPKI